jgi:hypothetical protein
MCYLENFQDRRAQIPNLSACECYQPNPVPTEEPQGMRKIIERLPTEVAAIRLGADPEPAMIKIEQLMVDLPSKWWSTHVKAKSNQQ